MITRSERAWNRVPEQLGIITDNIARTLGEIVSYPHSSPNARVELSESLFDYAQWIESRMSRRLE